MGTSLEATIDPVGDQDWFAIDVPGRGHLRLHIDPVPRDLVVGLLLHDAKGREIQRSQGRLPVRVELNRSFSNAARVYAHVLDSAWDDGESGYGSQWNNRASQSPYQIHAHFVPSPDPHEPNDEVKVATSVKPNTVHVGSLFPPADIDELSLELPEGARGVIWAQVRNAELNVGGKPFNSLPAFVPIAFEITVLFAGLGVVAALFIRCGLWPGKREIQPSPAVTNDKFVIALRLVGARHSVADARAFLTNRGAVHVKDDVEDAR